MSTALPAAQLTIKSGPQANTVYHLQRSITRIGRGSDNDLVLNDPRISHHHAILRHDVGQFIIQDLGSKNGLFVNDRSTRIEKLHAGDIIEIVETAIVFNLGQGTIEWNRPSVKIDFTSGEVSIHGKHVNIAGKPYQALLLLYSKCDQIVTTNELAEHIWPEWQGIISDEPIRKTMQRLRDKIAIVCGHSDHQHIRTMRNQGYILTSTNNQVI